MTRLTKLAPSAGNRIRGACLTAYRAYAPLVALVVLYYLSAALLLRDTEAQLSIELVKIFGNVRWMLPQLAFVIAVYGYARLLRRTEKNFFVRIGQWTRETPFLEIAFLRFWPMIVIATPVGTTYLAFKRQIPEFVPYSWDALLVQIDRVIFLGADPWTITHAILPWPVATWVMSNAYALWLQLQATSFGVAAMMHLDSRLRMTFGLSFILGWSVGGTVLAMAFSSAGPVYFERLFGDATFAPLMQSLNQQADLVPLSALQAQEILWRGYVDPSFPAAGISAFPSMHLCMSALMTFFAFGIARGIGWAMAGFTLLMLVASVHLGWHYAVDGFAGIALAALFWSCSRRFTDWWFGPEFDRLPTPWSQRA